MIYVPKYPIHDLTDTIKNLPHRCPPTHIGQHLQYRAIVCSFRRPEPSTQPDKIPSLDLLL